MSLDLSQCSDGELAALALGGEGRAYREFLRRYRDPVYRLVRNTIRDGEEAIDVTQESFVSAFAALKRYDRERPFRLWISRIALNKCRDWARRRAVRAFFTRAAPLDDAFGLASDEASPEDEAGDRAQMRRVNAVIAELPAKLREALVLRAVEGMSQAEHAEALDASKNLWRIAGWADTAYRSQANERWLRRQGKVSRIHRRKPKGRPMPERTAKANAAKSKVRARVDHVFAHQKAKMGLFIRTIGIKRAEARITLANLAFNMHRLIFHETRAATG